MFHDVNRPSWLEQFYIIGSSKSYLTLSAEAPIDVSPGKLTTTTLELRHESCTKSTTHNFCTEQICSSTHLNPTLINLVPSKIVLANKQKN